MLLAGCNAARVNTIPTRKFSPDPLILRLMQAYDKGVQVARGTKSKVDFSGQIPKLHNKGTLEAMRIIKADGSIEYEQMGYTGDDRIRKDVIYRYMQADAEPRPEKQNLGINHQNYKFEHEGFQTREGREVYILKVNPREKRVGLFKGEVWIDPETWAPIKEMGYFVKSPSVFFNKVEFTRVYRLQDGVPVTQHIESRIDAKIVGDVLLTVDFSMPVSLAAGPGTVSSNR